MPVERTRFGTALVVASAFAYSLAGFFTRLIELDAWTMLFWRGVYAGLMIGAFLVWQHRGGIIAAVTATGRPGILVAALSTIATIAFITALRQTSVADVMVINATAPFFAAGLGWLIGSEREHWTTLAASTVALAGVMLMIGGTATGQSLLGDLLAFVMTLTIAAMMVLIRRHRETSMLPAVCLSAFLCALAVWPAAEPSAARGLAHVYLFLFGTLQFGMGLLLLTIGTRYISATRAALIGCLETAIAPALVWACFGEAPALMTILGGTIVLGAVLFDIQASKD